MSIPLPVNERARLACLRSLDILDSAPEERFDGLVHVAAQLTNCPYALISFTDDCRIWFKAKVGLEGLELPREQAFCAYTIALGERVVITDTAIDSRFVDHPLVINPPALRFYAGFPIFVEDLAIGSICVIDTRPRRLSEKKLRALEALAEQASALLESKLAERKSATAERRFAAFMNYAPVAAFLKDAEGRIKYVNERFEQAFRQPAEKVLGCLESEWLPEFAVEKSRVHDARMMETGGPVETLERVPDVHGQIRDLAISKFPVLMNDEIWIGAMALDVTELREARRAAQAERDFSEAVMGTGGALICVVDRRGQIIRFNAECERITGWEAKEVLGRPIWEASYPPDEQAPVREMFFGLKPASFPLEHESRWLARSGERRLIEWRSTALLDDAGEIAFVVGTGLDITVRRAQEEVIRKTTRELRIQKRKLEEANGQLQALATTDELTRIANNRAFRNRCEVEVARAQRTGEPLSLALLDVDRFKLFNDEFGHQAGDETLRGVARVLSEASRKLDLVARYGGEEFVVLMPGTEMSEALAAAERLRQAIEAAEWPFRPVTASFGVATFSFGQSGESLVGEADRALYASKAAGRNRVTHANEVPDSLAA